MRLRTLPAAAQEVEAAAAHYDRERAGLGDEFRTCIEDALDRIKEAPSTQPRLAARHRFRLVGRFPFKIIYELRHDEIVIVAIAHHRRRPGYWRGRR